MTIWRRFPGCEWKQIYERSALITISATGCRIRLQGATPGDVFLDNLSVEELP
jgi:hypothetical protein